MAWSRLLLVVAIIVLASNALAERTTFQVHLVTDPKFPALSDARCDRVLRRASQLIKEVCRRDVAFEIVARRDADEWLDEQRRRIAPFDVPEGWAFDPFDTAEDVIDGWLRKACMDFDVPTLRSFVTAARAKDVVDRESAADATWRRYGTRSGGC